MTSRKLASACLSVCLIAAFMTGNASAQPVYLKKNVTADSIARAVSINGSAIVTTGPGTYERFVADQSQCAGEEVTVPQWNASGAYLGLVCEPNYSGDHLLPPD